MLAIRSDGLDDQHQVSIHKTGWHAMPDIFGTNLNNQLPLAVLILHARRHLKRLAKHVQPTSREEKVIPQSLRITFDAASPRRDVRHPAGRLHVTGLALLPFLAGRTIKPFRIGAVDMYAKDGAL